jgi:hypothetical protein
LSSSIDFSAEQLAAARATAWHQDGKALLTIEGARNWVDHFGLVLFAPRAQQLGAPAPSFIEATLGAANEAPTAADSATARSLAARLVAEGSALPLNLLGSPSDQPDFLASAKVFSYVFTMRGDKAWKQPPSTSEGTRVSPLAVRVWEVLGEKGALSAAELVSELGREVTEVAILRALNELWAQLRVIPQHQQDDSSPTLWELTSKRFAKAIKAGTNAGQPSAMSALLSLFLSQAVGATEEEVAAFLSPLTARSRVREVVHALIAGRQLEATVVDGKTLLHVSGTLPEFPAIAKPEPEEGTEPATEPAKKVGTGRIARFTGTDSKPRADFKGKPAFGAAPRERSAGPRGVRPGPRPSRPAGAQPETERRPFNRTADTKPTFTKPWEEDKRPRREAAAGASEGEAPRERKPYERKSLGDKPSYGPKKTYGDKPSFAGDRKPYGERTYGGSDSKPRRTFDKPAFGDRKPYGDRPSKPFGERKSFGDRKPSGDRPAYGDSGPRKPYGDRPSKPFGERKAYGDRPSRPRPEGGSEGFKPRERKSFGSKPSFGDRPARPRREGSSEGFAPRERSSYPPREGAARSFERKPFTPRTSSGGDDRPRRTFDKPRSFAPRPGGSSGFSKPDGDRKPFRKREDGDAPRSYSRPASDRPARPGGFGSKPAFGSKPSYGSKPSFGAKPRFSGGKPAGKFGGKPSFGAKPARPFVKKAGGAAPTRRKPETEE